MAQSHRYFLRLRLSGRSHEQMRIARRVFAARDSYAKVKTSLKQANGTTGGFGKRQQGASTISAKLMEMMRPTPRRTRLCAGMVGVKAPSEALELGPPTPRSSSSVQRLRQGARRIVERVDETVEPIKTKSVEDVQRRL